MGGVLMLAGLLAAIIAIVCLIYPIRATGIVSRRRAVLVFFGGLILFILGGALLPKQDLQELSELAGQSASNPTPSPPSASSTTAQQVAPAQMTAVPEPQSTPKPAPPPSPATTTAQQVVPATKATMAASHTSDPHWEANYYEKSAYSNAMCRLLGSVSDPNEPIIVSFDAKKGMANEMWLSGRFSPRSRAGATTPIVIKFDDNPRSWTLSARGRWNDASALLPGGREEDDFWKALYDAKILRLRFNGTDFNLGTRNFQVAKDRFDRCVQQLNVQQLKRK